MDSLDDIKKELEDIKAKRVGRPRGTKNVKKIKANQDLTVTQIVNTESLTREEKLRLLSAIARDKNSNSSDIIKAVQAHSEMIGETQDGFKKLIIKIELKDDEVCKN